MANPLQYAGDYWVEVDLDYVDQIAARAEYTLITIGPVRARLLSPVGKALFAINTAVSGTLAEVMNLLQNLAGELKPVGMARQIYFGVQRGRYPIQEIGSDMLGFASDTTTMVNVGISRLIAGVSSFLKKVKTETAPEILNDAPDQDIDFGLHGKASKWPFGMGVIMYAELNASPIGRLYIENCKIVSMSTGTGQGQPVMYEDIQIMAHRIVAFSG